jgi:uncharacterized protein (TIGR02099 family)
MESVTKSPSRALRFGSRAVTLVLAILMVIWLLVLVTWGLLHLWIVPHIGDFRPRIEGLLTQALGVPVQLGGLTAESNGVLPSFAATDVILGDPSSHGALHAQRAVISLSPRALWGGRADRISVEGLDTRIRRLPDGRIEVAGIVLDPRGAATSSAAADWVFSQPRIIVRGARVQWLDEQRGLPAVALSEVNITMRNGRWRHNWLIEATPPSTWGDRFTVAGRFRQRVLSLHSGRFDDWRGTVYARWTHFDAASWSAYLPTLPAGVVLTHASGGFQAWLDVRQGALRGGAVDLALQGLDANLVGDAPALVLRDVRGRLSGSRDATGFRLAMQQLGFATGDGLQWPPGDARLTHVAAVSGQQARTTLSADQIDLGVLAQLAERLPVSEASRSFVADVAPRGALRRLQVHWVGQADAPVDYRVQGWVEDLTIAAGKSVGSARAQASAQASGPGQPVAQAHRHPPASRPGVAGLGGHFDFSRDGGTAEVSIRDGQLVFPGVFEEPAIDIAQLQAGIRWKRTDQNLAVDVDHVSFANPDLAGEASIHWHTAVVAAKGASSASAAGETRPLPAADFPGVLDLSGKLSRADGTRVWRYLPLQVGDQARHYVRDAVRAGVSVGTQFRVRGDLRNMPFRDPAQGDFHVASQIRDARYAFVPPSVQRAGEKPWPLLDGFSGELIFDRAGMEVRNATGRLVMPDGSPGGLRVGKASTKIEDFSRAVVNVAAQAQGPLQDMLAVVNASPLADITSNALVSASASGPAVLSLKLGLPLGALDRSSVKGSVVMSGNMFRIAPSQPPLNNIDGSVAFTEKGFNVADVKARFLGGDLRIDGAYASGTPAFLRLRGTAEMSAVRSAPELAFVAPIATHAQGVTDYEATITLQKATPNVLVTSNLRGLALDLPPPFGKTADDVLPLRLEIKPATQDPSKASRGRQDISLSLGAVAALHYELEPATTGVAAPKVVRGSIALGLAADEEAPLPDSGVAANIHVDTIDIDRWRALLDSIGTTPRDAEPQSHNSEATSASIGSVSGFLPDTLAVRANLVTSEGRSLHRLVAGGSRAGNTWRMTLAAEELEGYVEYRQAAVSAPAKVFARLARLRVPQSTASDVERLLDAPPTDQPASALPALDIVVDALELKGRELGRVAVVAINRAAPHGKAGEREWELNKLDIEVPEAHFSATGNWSRRSGTEHPVTALDFRLDIRDSGALLARFGMPGLIRQSPGSLWGTASWRGSPIEPDFTTMDGELHLNLTSGQFLKAEPGIAKLLGVLSLQSLPRRLALDFRDVFSQGFAFDWVRGDVAVRTGVARTENLKMKGVSAAVLMEGQTDLGHETQDLHVVVIPEINAGTASLVAAAINPAIGLASFLAQVLLRGPLTQAATREFRITGSWTDPKVVRLTGDDRTGAPTGAR